MELRNKWDKHMFKKSCLGLTVVILLSLFISSSVTAGTVQLPRTGQTTCYDSSGNVINCAGTWQDGEIPICLRGM